MLNKPIPPVKMQSLSRQPVSKQIARVRLYLLGMVLDLWMMLGCFVLANRIGVGSFMGEPGKPHGFVMFVLIAPVYTVLAINGGAYGIQILNNVRASSRRAIFAFIQAVLLALVLVFLAKISDQLSRLTLLVGFVLSIPSLILSRMIIRRLAYHLLGDVPRIEAYIVDGSTEVPPPAHMLVIDAQAIGLDPTRHDAAMAAKLADAVAGAEHIVVSCPESRLEDWSIALKSLAAKGEILVPGMARFGPAHGGTFEHRPTLVVAGGPLTFRDRIIKRWFDVGFSLAAIIVLSPILLATALAIKLTSPGPVLFKQQRLGRDARAFEIFKFRSMRSDMTDSRADQLTQKDDPRVTRIGAFIRKTSIDELPQFFNVLRGDMSIVGPRPHAPGAKAAEALYWEVDSRYWARHCIKPGITGLAQIRGHRGNTLEEEDLVRRLQSDLEYVTDWSIWRDLRIVAATLGVLVHHNAY
jgi:polysaccharide biosynthesis protein PslA